MNESFQIQRLSEENFSLFYTLFCQVFDSNTPYDFLYQKYNSAYLGDKYRYLGYLALNQQGEAVSYCGAIPFRFQVDGKEYIGAHSCDHMTRSDARKKGLFVQLNDRADALCKSLNIPFVFGFPNQNNHPILVKYGGWKIIDTMQVFEIPVSTIPVSSIAQRLGPAKQIFEKYADRKMKKRITEKIIRRQDWDGIIRDQAFYTYKTYSASRMLQFEHGLVWAKLKGALFIGDIELGSEQNLDKLLKELKAFARRLGIRKIIFLASSNLQITQLFKTRFPAISGNGVGIKVIHKEGLPSLDKMQFTLGDYDTY